MTSLFPAFLYTPVADIPYWSNCCASFHKTDKPILEAYELDYFYNAHGKRALARDEFVAVIDSVDLSAAAPNFRQIWLMHTQR